MTTTSVSGGQSLSGVTIAGGDTITVFAGGTVTATTVGSGAGGSAFLAISSGGAGSANVIASSGHETVYSGGVARNDTVAGGGYEVVFGGTIIGPVVSSGGQLEALDGSIGGAVVNSGARMLFTDGGSWHATVTGTTLQTGGVLDLFDISYASGAIATYDASTGTLRIDEGGQSKTLSMAGDYTGRYFHVGPAAFGSSDTLVTVDATPCYCPGTRILAEAGEVAIERLRIGDRVMTRDGSLQPIRWIGRRSYAGRFAVGNPSICPVVVRAGALGAGLPRRDLWVSPEHALFLDGMLVPAGALVNGVSIVRTTGRGGVDYLHIELDRHDVVFAEGAAAETFLDDGNRAAFQNAREYRTLHSTVPSGAGRYCAARLEDGEALEALRTRLSHLGYRQALGQAV